MLTFYKKYWRTAFDIALIVLTVYLFMFLFSYLYQIAAPIFLSLIIFAIIEPLARLLNKWGIKKSIASGISMLLFITLLLAAVAGAGALFTAQILQLSMKIPQYADVLSVQFIEMTDWLQTNIAALPPELADNIQSFITFITAKGSEWISLFLLALFQWVSSFSAFMLHFVIAIILAYFLSLEINMWRKAASDKTPGTFKKAYFFLRDNVLKGIVGYVKAQLILVSLTFLVIFITLLFLGVSNAFSISLLAAVFDLLPLLGVSTVFLPWIIYLFVVGDTVLAFWLLGLWAAVILTRQILEPKITGDTLGVSAFTMLAFMVVSLSLFGIAGLILSPILIILVKELYVQGYLKSWIRMPED